MSRTAAASKPLPAAAHKQLGVVPNLMPAICLVHTPRRAL